MATDSYPKIYLYRRIVQAKLFIDNNFSEKIDLNNIADEAFFSKFHFMRLFKKIYAKSPHQYLTSVRVEAAKKLLTKDIAISEVCYAVGFDSVSSFTGLFKKIVGQTPSAYQFHQLKLQSEIMKAPLKFIPDCFAEMKGWKKTATFEK